MRAILAFPLVLVTLLPATPPRYSDSAGDGTPDLLRLDSYGDRQAFRQWFVWLAEAEYFTPPRARPVEIDDCAALVRFAYREALHIHDSAWANSVRLPEFPPYASVSKYQYPFTLLGSALFRVRSGPFHPADLTNGAFIQFADAKSLWKFNTHLIGRNIDRAEPGDLLLYRQDHDARAQTFHAMIYVGRSEIRNDGKRYLIYHTGPIDSGPDKGPGEIRRPTVEELMHFPQAEWRPVAANPAFLGVMRWNILRGDDDEEMPR